MEYRLSHIESIQSHRLLELERTSEVISSAPSLILQIRVAKRKTGTCSRPHSYLEIDLRTDLEPRDTIILQYAGEQPVTTCKAWPAASITAAWEQQCSAPLTKAKASQGCSKDLQILPCCHLPQQLDHFHSAVLSNIWNTNTTIWKVKTWQFNSYLIFCEVKFCILLNTPLFTECSLFGQTAGVPCVPTSAWNLLFNPIDKSFTLTLFSRMWY